MINVIGNLYTNKNYTYFYMDVTHQICPNKLCKPIVVDKKYFEPNWCTYLNNFNNCCYNNQRDWSSHIQYKQTKRNEFIESIHKNTQEIFKKEFSSYITWIR